MKPERLATLVGLMVLIGLIIGCSPSKIDNSSVGTVITGPTTTVAASALALTANPSTIAPSGSSTITAHVVDTLGNNVPDGTVVNFAFAPGDQVKARLSNGSVQTVNGTVTVTVTATTFSSAIATVNASSGSASASIAITITAGVAGGSVTVSAAPSTIISGNTSTITATVKDNGGNPVANATVTFSLNNNTLATLSQTSANTNASGVATTILTGVAAGSVTATAAVQSGGTSGQCNITINPVSSVPTITLSSTASSILTNGTVTISAALSGFGSSPVNNLAVTFTVSNGSVAYLLSSTPTATGTVVTATTDGNGIATVVLQANNIVTPVTVNASYTTLNGTATITITAPPPDTIVVTPNQTPITVFGTSTITATVSGGGKPVPDGTLVNFIISDSTFGSLSNALGSTVGGNALTTFSAVGKVGSVTISAAAGGVSATTTVSINAADAGSIQFLSAVPQVIGIQGSGQPETSTITFSVKDINGKPVADGASVTFTMNGPGGGSYIGSIISSQTATASTISGSASAIIHSGSTAGPVTVIATAKVNPNGSSTISSSASQLSIGGGVASANHWNLATTAFNLPGLLYSDRQATITAYIADRFGNYNILQGTTINFYAEAGAIDRVGTTDATGKSSVVFRTQSPLPLDVTPAVAGDPVSVLYYNSKAEPYTGTTHNPRDGWVTVLATAMGEEAFLDENGNGLFTRSYGTSPCPSGYTCECDGGTANGYAGYIVGDGIATCSSGGKDYNGNSSTPGGSRSEGFIDLGEPFIDANDDGVWSGPTELFIDANGNGVYDGPNGMWDGPDCNNTNSACLRSKMIWKDIRLIFTGNPVLYTDGLNDCSGDVFTSIPGGFEQIPAVINKGGKGSFTVCVGDDNLNRIEPGSTITASASVGSVTLTNSTNPIPDGLSKRPTRFSFDVAIPITDTTNNATTVGVTITTTSGYVLSYAATVPLKAFTITTSNPLPNGTVGTDYSVTFAGFAGTGGSPPYSWTADVLPPGFMLNSTTGVLSGMPTLPMSGTTYTITVTITDTNGWSTSKPYSLTIN